MAKFIGYLIGALAVALVVILVAGLLAFVTQWAFNGVMVATFSLPAITLVQAFQLNLLAGLLVKSTQTNNNSR